MGEGDELRWSLSLALVLLFLVSVSSCVFWASLLGLFGCSLLVSFVCAVLASDFVFVLLYWRVI